MSEDYVKIARFKDVDAFRQRLDKLKLDLPLDDSILTAAADSPLAEPIEVGGFTVGNRWCIHPMEGWDANPDGSPSELTLRRWRNFGLSGAKLIWGGEAAAVSLDGRANPNQTLGTSDNEEGLRLLLATLTNAHAESFGSTDDLLVGLRHHHRPWSGLEGCQAVRLVGRKMNITGEDPVTWKQRCQRFNHPITSPSAASSRSTLRFVAACPISPILQAFPAKGPSPAPISMEYSLSKRLRTGASSTPSGMETQFKV